MNNYIHIHRWTGREAEGERETQRTRTTQRITKHVNTTDKKISIT